MKLKSTKTSIAEGFRKLIVFGPAGIGKTMLAATAAPYKPVIILTERTGQEALSETNINKVWGEGKEDILYDIPYVEAYDYESFNQALKDLAADDQFNLVIFDSISKASRWILKNEKAGTANTMRAYGESNEKGLSLLEDLMMLDKHVVFVAHETRIENQDGEMYVPALEGKTLIEKLSYEFTTVLHYGREFQDDGTPYRALRAEQGATNKRVKNRSGILDELNQPHLGKILDKLSGK